MDISPKLQMNLHPKDANNLSLVTALNVKLSNDENCITNEESIRENTFISNFLKEYYKDNDGNYYDFTIIAIIPCNIELAIIAIKNNDSSKAQIFRYREKTINSKESMQCAYGDNDTNYFEYHGGKIKGTFTYNVENSLILAIAEYDGLEEKIPLRTINLGSYDDPTIFNDKDVPDKALSIAPEVRIPSMRNLEYITGNAYKGWYYLFIRFKINSVDYTQWFSFGFPIYVDTLEKYAITRYCYRQKITGISNTDAFEITNPVEPEDGFCAGASDYFSNTSDIANETFKIDIKFDSKNNIYSKYQIGIICASKSYTKAFRTSDINFNWGDSNIITTEFILNNASLIEAAASDFIVDNYNYFDVKNIINYKNKLYISNYKENNANDKDIIDEEIVDKIKLKLSKGTIYGSPISYDYTISSKYYVNQSNQYDGTTDGIPGTVYFNLKPNEEIVISGNCDIYDKNGKRTLFGVTKNFKIDDVSIIPSSTEFNIENESYVDPLFRSWTLPSHIAIAAIIKAESSEYGYIIYKFYNDITITKVIYNEDADNVPSIKIDGNNFAVNGGTNYINVNTSFNDRKINKTLIPGEVYNFFIHFVDKYGHCTNGYRINNNIVWITEDSESEIVPIAFSYNGKTYYASMPVNSSVLNSDGSLNTNGLKIYSVISAFHAKLTKRLTDDKYKKAFESLFSNFADSKYNDVKWFQIASGYNAVEFLPYYNNNGDKLFKVPIAKHNGTTVMKYGFDLNGVEIPDNYVGYFISYEKFEPIKRITGMLTRNDFKNQESLHQNGKLTLYSQTANGAKSDLMYFYSGQYDISDSIRLDYNLMSIEGVNVWDKNDIPKRDYNQRGSCYKFCHDMNKPQLDIDDDKKIVYLLENAPALYSVPEYKLAIADSATDNRMGLGTALQLKDSYNLFPIYYPLIGEKNEKIKLYKVTLFNANRDIYMSNNKTLIRCTNIIYGTNLIDKDKTYNGVMTYDGCIIYNSKGLNFNTANNIAYRLANNTKYYPSDVDGKHTFEVNSPFMAYLQTPCVDDHFYESKCFKNEPTGYVFYVKQDTTNLDKANENNKFQTGCIVTPANSIDLFENRQSSSDIFNPKTFTNYREDLVAVDNYEKTIRRSAVIQDETRTNGWRTFPVEAYKNITENKGIITNLIGIGTMLLVHTEHSLFMFDTDNTLETKDKSIQLSQPDAFEVSYKEVFTSALGYGGLQDDKSYVIDQFGYTFYNNDFHRFYNFDNGQLNTIDGDIIQWLDKYKPYNVRFANDKFNNRILIKMNYQINNIEKDAVLSYNYNTNHFVSLHNYYFDEAFNTKSQLYLKCDSETHTNCSLHQFVQDGSSYGSFDNVKAKMRSAVTYPSKIGIIINEQYDDIKFLEYITYKLNKFANPTEIDYTYSPVERMVTPYSADLLKVYNNEVNTGELNILIDKEKAKNAFCDYTKPYWELGNWNYSYLRNNIADRKNYGDAFTMSRIFGNYFVVEFTFSNTDNLKVEFEELKYKISK